MDPDPGYFSRIFKFFVLFFSLIFTLKLYEPFRNLKKYFWSIFCPLDPHIFTDPDPGSQNLADPDPKRRLIGLKTDYFQLKFPLRFSSAGTLKEFIIIKNF